MKGLDKRIKLVSTPDKEFNVIIVDDDKEVLDLMNEIFSLEFPSIKIHTSNNAANAISLIQELSQKGSKINVVLTDYMMPGMNGAELCKIIKCTHSEIKIAVMTGFMTFIDEMMGDFDACFYKPIDFQALFKYITQQIRAY